jgi:hypothetical protein
MCGGHTAGIFQRRNTNPAMAAPSIKSVEPVSGVENMRKLSPRGESEEKPGWPATGV